MALATLTWQDTDDDYIYFDMDIGVTNRYYRYHIGDKSIRRFNGLKRLGDPKFTSSLMGPLPKESLGRKSLEIPKEQFDREHHYIQLFSFRTPELDGPAQSEVVAIPAVGLPDEHDSFRGQDRNAVSLSWEEDSMPSPQPEQPPVEVVAFSYKEAPPVEVAMALGGFTNLIKKFTPLAKKAASVVTSPQAQTALKQAGSFLTKPQNQQMLMNAGTALMSNSGSQGMNNQMLMQLLMNFLNQSGMAGGMPQTGMMPGVGTMPAMAGANPMAAQQNPMLAAGALPTQQLGSQLPNSSAVNTTMLAQQQLQKLPNNQLRSLPTANVNRYAQARSLSTAASVASPAVSKQMAFPALAALPSLLGGMGAAGATGGTSALMGGANMSGLVTSLMPLLQQVLTPETVQMMMQNMSPTKMLGAVTDSVTQVAKVNLEDKKQDQQHIEKLIANADDTSMEKWAYGAAVVNALAWSPEVVDYRRVARVRLDFVEVTPLMLHGRSRVLYHQDHDIAFPLKLETPRPISKGILQILVKDPESLEILLEKKYKVEDLNSGPLDVVPTLTRDELELLEPNEDYLVTVVLAWKGRSRRNPSPRRKKRMGTSMTQMITLMRDYCFDRIEGQSETVALNDVDRYRSYWHKVWQGQLSSRRRRITLDCKYYYTLERDRTTLARMETLTRIQQPSDSRQEGQLKAGMMLNPERLNELLGQISDHEPLDDEQLNALFNTDNISLFQALARTEVKFKGRRGSTVALWVYPELKIQRILLKQASEIDENGHVTELVEAPVYFPMPAKAHFIGVSDDD